MLITFSGIVGSGKSTNAKYARDMVEELAQRPVYLRFRFLSWKKMLAGGSKRNLSNPQQKQQGLRTSKIAPLTFVRFVGYLGRMLNFRLFRLIKLRQCVAICDRYFYDNLVHYRLESLCERIYLQILKKAMPAPDISFMLTADPETIIQRRRHYEPNYIYKLSENYKKVAGAFENLTIVKTDGTKEVAAIIARHIREKMNGTDAEILGTKFFTN
ncbi:MAG: hypothetical protein ACE5I1_25980 [bacterium]